VKGGKRSRRGRGGEKKGEGKRRRGEGRREGRGGGAYSAPQTP